MKLFFKTIFFLFFISFVLSAKSKGGVRMNITLPQFSNPSSNGVTYPVAPGITPYFFNNPAYGNLLLNQYNANMNAITSRIPQPQSDLGAQYLDRFIQKEITDDITIRSSQPSNSLPMYRITNIIDHGRSVNNKDPKFKNVDYLLWKFQNLEEGISVQIKENQIEFGQSVLFVDKPDSLLKFIRGEKDDYFLLESRVNGVLTGLLVNPKTRKVTKLQCNKVKENYEYLVLGEEGEFWSYLALFENSRE